MQKKPQQRESQNVHSLELFFDLVFVFAVSRLTLLVLEARQPGDYVFAALIFVSVVWTCGAFVWLADSIRLEDSELERWNLLLGMACFFGMAVGIPHLVHGNGWPFAVSLVSAATLDFVTRLRVNQNAQQRRGDIGPMNLVTAGVIGAAVLLAAPLNRMAWSAALASIAISAFLRTRRGMPFFRVGHFVERHGLILIIALGEGVVALGVGASSQALSLKVLGTVVAGLLLLATLWWAYFGLNQRAAEHRLVNAEPGRRIGMANDFDFAHYPLLAGSILIATALEATIHHPLGHAQSGAAWHLWSGTALFSIGLVLLRWRLGLQAHLPLTLGTTIAALAAIWPVETALLWQIIAAAALMLCIGFSKVSNPGPHEVR